MRALSLVLTITLSSGLLPAQDRSGLAIVVLQGEGAKNSASGTAGQDIVVQVNDPSNKPVEGAMVTAILPSFGPGGSFSHGFTTSSKQTGGDGKARFGGIRIRRAAGDYKVKVVANHTGRMAAVNVNQTADATLAVKQPFLTPKRMVMLGILGGGAAAAIYAWTHNASAPTTNSTGFTATPGSPNLTGPR